MNRLEIVEEWQRRGLARPHVVIDGQLKWAIQDVHYFARQCLGEEPAVYDTGRHALFDRCETCGDPGCGAVTARIEFDDWKVTWSDFHWEVDYAFEEGSDAPRRRLVDEGEYSFKRERYEALMNDMLKRRSN